MPNSVRIDKFLWAVRIYKTRSEAAHACKSNKVKIDGQCAKPSKEVKIGEELTIRKGPVEYTYKIKALVENRVGAKLVADYIENLTPQSKLDKLSLPQESIFLSRQRGEGRPTKKDRRSIDSLMQALDFDA